MIEANFFPTVHSVRTGGPSNTICIYNILLYYKLEKAATVFPPKKLKIF